MNVKDETKKLISIFDMIIRENEEIVSFTKSNWDFLYQSRIYYYDKPDIIFEANNVLYAFEHFQFNASKPLIKNGRSYGDSFSYEDNRLKMELDFVNKIEEVRINTSLQFYKSNFCKAFKNHSDKLNTYLQSIKKCEGFCNKDIKLGFWCEDTIPFGTYVTDEIVKTNLVPIMIREIYDEIKKTDWLDYCIFTTESPNRKVNMYIAEIGKLDESVIVDVDDKNFFIHKFKNITRTIKIP